jgi:adenylyltransferase/sulfurtransferase
MIIPKIVFHSDEYGETPYDRTKLISWWEQDIVDTSSVLVVGAGAIGNETLKNLALLGVGKIFICDMDTISISNLSRTVLFGSDDVGKEKATLAAERVIQMSNNKNCKVDYFVGDITTGLGHGVFRRFDIVLGCLDNMLTRVNVNRRCCLLQKPLLDAGIWELGLSLSVHHYPYSSCLQCGMDSKDIENERRIRYACDNFKKRDIHERHAPTTLVSTAIVGALQVQEAIKVLHNLNKDKLERDGKKLDITVQYGKKYYYQGLNHLFEQMTVPTKDTCDAHFSFDEVVESPLSADMYLCDALDSLKDLLGYDCIIDTYPESWFVIRTRCVSCHNWIDTYKAKGDLYQEDLLCDECSKYSGESLGYTPESENIDVFGRKDMLKRLMNFTLRDLGIPPLHIITVRAKNDESIVNYVELTGDLSNVLPNTFGSILCTATN